METFCYMYDTTPEIVESSNLFAFRYLCYRNIPLIRNIKLPTIVKRSDKEAVLIEFRILPHIEFVLRNAIYKLGEGWSHTIVCGKMNYRFLQSICKPISNNIRIIVLDYDNIDINIYNNICYDPLFWKDLYGENILLYQEDSILFTHKIDDFLRYDYVGAPWNLNVSSKYRVGNGGLSLRNKRVILSILEKNRKLDTLEDIQRRTMFPNYDRLPEDVFFAKEIRDETGNVPSVSIASFFSTEHIVNKDSFGGHQFWLFDPTWKLRMEKLVADYEHMLIVEQTYPLRFSHSCTT